MKNPWSALSSSAAPGKRRPRLTLVAVWNYFSINQYLEQSSVALDVPRDLKIRWYYSYVHSGVLLVIGLMTFLYPLRVI